MSVGAWAGARGGEVHVVTHGQQMRAVYVGLLGEGERPVCARCG